MERDHSQTEHAPRNIGSVIAIMSGKGGVGKSSVSALVATALRKAGRQVGVLDADITGPSIPRLFGLRQPPETEGETIIPAKTSLGISVMSLNLLLEHEEDPVVWRGPLISGAIKQFWDEVAWGDLDFLVVDLPPGTGDAVLTVLQTLPLSGVIVVSSPQELTAMVVKKAINMTEMMGIPVIGLIENMSGLICPHCGELIEVFGPSQAERVAAATGIRLIGRLPLDPELRRLGDEGKIEAYDAGVMRDLISVLALPK